MKMMHHSINRIIALVLVLCLGAVTLSGCDISSKHLEMEYGENDNDGIVGWDDVDNDDVTTWDNASVVSWSDVDEYSDWVYSELLFNDISEDMPIVECRVLDYQSNGTYFDGEKIYTLVGDRFDVNTFIAQYAVGTGVIVICVVLNVATAGITTPVACFIAGAADASVSMAIKGAAFGAATRAVLAAIRSGGDIEEVLYGSLEGSAEGYMWGAIYGAATGGFSSQYCFAEDTSIITKTGLQVISGISIGDFIYSYDETTGNFGWNRVSQIICGDTLEFMEITVSGEKIRTTENHPFLTSYGWIPASQLVPGNYVFTGGNEYHLIEAVRTIQYCEPQNTYNLCVENAHTFLVSDAGVVVHNRCKPNEKYANQTYYFPEGTPQAAKYPNGVPFDANGWPRFEQYAEQVATFEYPTLAGKNAGTCLVGNCSTDFAMANTQVGLTNTPAGYTWHHCEDMQTMLLVPQDLHSTMFGGVAHAGGESMLRDLWAALAVVTP